jgi:hypothetical protein
VLDDIGAFFGQSRDYDSGVCQAPCSAGCPEHYSCNAGGIWCQADAYWANPVPAVHWSGGAEGKLEGRDKTTLVTLEVGKAVELEAEASSPLGMSISDFKWTITDQSGQAMLVEGHRATFVFGPEQMAGRADLVVSDPDSRTGNISVEFQGCLGVGQACGYEGSGCCNGCDDQKAFCL